MTVAGWRSCRLGDLLEIKHGYALRGEYFAAAGTHIVLTPGNFLEQGGFKDKAGKEKWYCGPIPHDFVLNEGEVIVAMTEQAEGLLGSSAIIPRSGLYLHNQRLGLVQVRDHSAVDKRFLYYLFHSKRVRQQIRATATGTKVRHTAPSRIAEVEVDIPPIAVQRRIAGVLRAYDSAMENDLRRMRILEEIARAIYREWFVDLRLPGHLRTREAAEVAGCSEGTLEELGRVVRERFDEVSQSDLPLLDLAHIPSRSLAPSDLGRSSDIQTARILFRPGDTLFGAIRPYLHKVVLAPFPGVTNVSVLVMRPRRPEFRSILAIAASSPDTIRWADQHSAGTKMPVINWSVFKTMPVPVPSTSLAAKFEGVAGPLLDQVATMSVRNQVLRRTRDLLLPRLLSGQTIAKESA